MKPFLKNQSQTYFLFPKIQRSFKLICSLLFLVSTLSTLQGQTCVEDANSQVQGIITGTGTSNAIYTTYSTTGNSTWASANWTGQIDFSGIAFDDNRAGTLISPRHILMAQHYQRAVGSILEFHDSAGNIHTATLIAKQSIPGGLNPDITVGLLDTIVPVKYYKVLPPRTDWDAILDGALVVSTHHTRNASIREISGTGSTYMYFNVPTTVPASYYAPAVGGNSGNPSFLILNGEPIVVSAFTFGGTGTGPFFSSPSNFSAINSIMTSLGGGYQLDSSVTCPAEILLPVNLMSFEASKKNQSVNLNWSTASETNNDRFDIEKSHDGLTFEKIGEVQGMGTTNERNDYQFLDDNPYFGNNYYRLKQVDFEGRFDYSAIQTVNVDSKRGGQFLISPNPAIDHISLIGEHKEIETLTIYGIDGSVLDHLNNVDQANIDISILEPGIYLLKIEVLNESYIWTKLIKN